MAGQTEDNREPEPGKLDWIAVLKLIAALAPLPPAERKRVLRDALERLGEP